MFQLTYTTNNTSLLTPIPPSCMVTPESNIANIHSSPKPMNPNVESTKARPDDTALSIQRGRPPSRASTESSRSSSPSLMDDSPPSDCDYAEPVAAQNNMDIVADNAPSTAGSQRYDFTMPPSQTPRAPHEGTPNDPPPTDNFNTSPEPSPPTVIPYSANVPADPNLWDGNFTATSLFGTNEFLQSDVRNMACSLQRMACFLKQRSLEGCDGNNIPQLELFGESAWDFISAIFESGWDQLHSSENTSIRDNISTHFGNIQIRDEAEKNTAYPKTSIIRKIPPPIPPRPSKNKWRVRRNTRKHARPRVKALCLPPCPMPRPPTPWPASLRSKKHSQLCQIRKSSRYTTWRSPNQITRDEKYNTPQRACPENRLLYPPLTKSRTPSWEKLTPTFSRSTCY